MVKLPILSSLFKQAMSLSPPSSEAIGIGVRSIGTNTNRCITVLVEGNIASGKSTCLAHLAKHPRVQIFEEPVELWRNVGGINLLDKMYSNPSQWSFEFQVFALDTRLEVHKATVPPTKQIKVIERSVFSGHYCFASNLRNLGQITEEKFCVLNELFRRAVANNAVQVDYIVYLSASPQTCFNRLKVRSREEEMMVPLSYLEQLSKLHDDWLKERKFALPAIPTDKIIVINAEQNPEALYKEYSALIDKLTEQERLG